MIERKSLASKGEGKVKKDDPGRFHAVLAFLLTALLLCVLYAVLQFFPFGKYSVIISDLGAQYAPDLIAYKNQFLSDGLHSYSFLIGMGKNAFGLFAYYLASPVNFVTFLFPTSMISEAVLVLITIKLSLAAAFMTLFLRMRFHTDSRFAIVFGIMYAFSSYAMIYMINIMWLDGFLLLPLLIYFIEQYLENPKHWWRAALTLFVLFVSGFYIAYMVGIFSFLYLCVRLFEKNRLTRENSKNTWKTLGIFILGAVSAAGMSAAVLIPAGMDIFGNPDHSAKNIAVATNFKFAAFLNQLLAGSFDSLSNNKPLIYCGLAVLFLCVLFFLNPCFSRRQKGLAGSALLFFLFCFNFSLLDLAWQLFDSPNWFLFRYSFLMVFVLLVIAFASLVHLKTLKPKAFAVTGIMFLALLFFVQGFGDLGKQGDRFYINLFMGGLQILCLLAMTRDTFPESIKNLRGLVPPLLVILICIEIACVNPLYMHNVIGGSNERELLVSSTGQAEPLVIQAKADGKKDGVSFFRMETDGEILDSLHPMNAGLYLNYQSISTFNSSANKDLNRLLKQLGYDANYNYFTASHMYTSMVTDSLLGVRYILSDKENCAGYELIGRSANGNLFLQKNSQALPLMYAVQQSAAGFDFFAMEKAPLSKNLFEFQDQLLVSLFGDKAFSLPVYYTAKSHPAVVYNAIVREAAPTPKAAAGAPADSSKVSLSPQAAQPPQLSSSSQITASDGKPVNDFDLLGNEPFGQKMDFGTTYLRISVKDSLSLTYKVDVTSTDPLYLSLPAVERNDQADVYVDGVYCSELSSSSYSRILYLGTFKPGDTVTVTVRADVDTFSIISALFYYCDTALFEKELSSAQSGQDVQIVKAQDGYVSAQISAQQDELILTAIPYEKGWTLTVDGVTVPITPYQSALISFPVTKGTHTAVLSFTPPGMQAGACISVISFLAFFGASVITYRRRGQKNETLERRTSAGS